MRPFEIALIVGLLLTFVLLLVPRLRGTIWPVVAGLAAAAIAIVQLLIDGSRWQVLPAYGLASVLLLAAFLSWRLAPITAARSLWLRFALGAGIIAAGLLLAVAATLPWAIPMFSFPAPTGPYAIGTLTYHWTDPNRADFGDPAAKRELMVQIWYPAVPSPQFPRDTYIQNDMRFGPLPGTPFPAFFSTHLNAIRTHALQGAPVAANGGRYPVLVFSPGAEGFRQHNTFEVEELVSHGYVVAGLDHPRAAREVVFPDGRRIEFDPRLVDVPRFLTDAAYGETIYNYLASDVSFALDQIASLDREDPNGLLAGHLDLDHAGMFGVSLGGLVTAEACRTDPRLKACLIQDVFVPKDAIAAGTPQPTMWLASDAASMHAAGWPDWEVDLHQSSMRAAYQAARSDAYLAHVPGMFHLNFTDFPYTLATPVARALNLIGPIDWREGHRIVNAYALSFFDRHLKDQAAPLLDGPSPEFPQVQVESRHRS
jgi:predicted dienelactone hydrolase